MEIVNNMSHNKIEEALVQCKPVTISLQRCIDQLVSLHCGRIGFTIQYGDLAKSPTAKKKKLKKKLYDAIFSSHEFNKKLTPEQKLLSWFLPDVPLAWSALYFQWKSYQNNQTDLHKLDLLIGRVLACKNSTYDSVLSVLMLLSQAKVCGQTWQDCHQPLYPYFSKQKIPSLMGPPTVIASRIVDTHPWMTKPSHKNENLPAEIMHYDEVALLSRLASPDVLSPGDVYNLPMLFPTQELDLMQFLRNKFHKSSTDEGCYTARSETKSTGRLIPIHDQSCSNLGTGDDQPYIGYKKPCYDVAVWENASKIKVDNYCSWDTIDKPARRCKVLYLTEAGAAVYDTVWQYRCRIIHELAAHLRRQNRQSDENALARPIYYTTDEATLLYHSRLVCYGIASETFHFNKIANMFLPKKNVHLSGVTTSSLRVLLKHFAEWGTAYWRLFQFLSFATNHTAGEISNEHRVSSVIFKAFCEGVRCYLYEYQRFLMCHEVGVETLLQRYFKFRRLGAQLCEIKCLPVGHSQMKTAIPDVTLLCTGSYMCSLCYCGDPSDSHVMTLDNFPTGVSILSYIYEEALFGIGSPNHLLLLYLLRKCCLPYLQFVQNWVFRGICWDMSRDFMIRVNHDNAARKDRQRWSNYVIPLSFDEQKSIVPSFLLPVSQDLFLCGKTIELLHNIAPNHFLCVHSLSVPDLIVTFSKSRIELNGKQWYNLQCEMRELELKRSVSWLDNEKKKKQMKQASLAAAIAAHDEMVGQKMEENKNILIQTDKLKQAELRRLKQEAEDEAERKRSKLKKRQEEQKVEAKQDGAEKTLHQKAKDELISHYHSLYEEADKRKRMAEWKIMRFNLAEKRRLFFESEKIYFARKDEMDASQLLDLQKRESLASGSSEDMAEEPVQSVPILAHSAAKTISDLGGEMNPMRRKQVDGQHVSKLQGAAENNALTSIAEAPAARHISELGGEVNPMQRKRVSGQHVSRSVITFQADDINDAAKHSRRLLPALPETTFMDSSKQSESNPLPNKFHRKPVTECHVSQSSLQAILNEDYKIGDSDDVKPVVVRSSPPKLVKHNASDSTIQNIMYKGAAVKVSPNKHNVTDDVSALGECENEQKAGTLATGGKASTDSGVSSPETEDFRGDYQLRLPQSDTYEDFVGKMSKRLNINGQKTNSDLLDSVDLLSFHRYDDEHHDEDILGLDEEAAVDLHVLPNLLGNCIIQPIKWHARLVNRCAVNYFMMDLNLPLHFKTLRRYLLLEDGEFGSALSRKLFELGHSGRKPAEVFNPLNLDSILEHSFQATRRNTISTHKLSLALKYLPQGFSTTNLQILDCLELCYYVEWPCNIIITQGSHNKYNQILSFLLQLNYVSWALHDTRNQLNSLATGKRNSKLKRSEIQKLQIYRHEMLNFVKVMQGYVSTQVLYVCWQEFWEELRHNINDLDDLHQRHVEYLNKCIMRCLLTKKAQNVMNVILDVLKSILRFQTQLSASVSLPLLYKTHNEFTRLSNFLYKVVSKLVAKGYQPHLEDFLTRLNFNGFYKD